jgi:MYXO-CTERM domain-containing protein
VPPYADYIGRYYANDSGSGGGTTTGGVPLPPQGQIGVPIDPSVPAPGSGTTNGETSGTPKSGTSPAASSGDTGGCQVGHGGTSAGASLLALFGLIGLTRRRARR